MRLVIRRKVKEDSGVALVCSRCTYTKEVTTEVPLPPRVIEHTPQEQIAVIGEQEAKIKTMPTTRMECPKCSNREAYWWMVQTRGSDESPTQFFRCTECGFTWREMT